MGDTRSALVVANYEFQDAGLRRLRAPARDAEALAEVLEDPTIGGFDVRTVLNAPAHLVSLAIEQFFANRRADDLLLLHFSGHGVKDESGDLYFAAANTNLSLLGATAVSADFVNRLMARTRSRRVVLLLDCCYAGAFERGLATRGDTDLHLAERLGGRGRVVITASTAMEYAFEGMHLTDTAESQPSVFTSALVEALRTGDADTDQDGMVGLDELYDYVYDKVRSVTPNQTPSKWTLGFQGELYIARRCRPVSSPAPLPEGLQEALESPFVGVRAGAVQELDRVLRGSHAGRALAARQALERLANDDSRTVAQAAGGVLAAAPPADAPAPAAPESAVAASPAGAPVTPKPPDRVDGPSSEARGVPPATDADADLEFTGTAADQEASVEQDAPVEPRAAGTAEPEVGVPETERPETERPETGGAPDAPDGRRPRRAAVIAGAAAAVVALVTGTTYALVQGGGDTTTNDHPNEGGTPSPNTTPTRGAGEGGHSGAAIPDGNIVVTARGEKGNRLLSVNAKTGKSSVLASGDSVALPTISPDREKIIYLVRDADGLATPRIIDADGDRDHLLFNTSSGCRHSSRPAWNGDGSRIALICMDGDPQLMVVEPDGDPVRTLSFRGTPTEAPTWASSGDREVVVFQQVNKAGTGSSLWAIDPGRLHPRPTRLTDADGYDSHPDAGENGLLFLRGPASDNSIGDVWVLTAEGDQLSENPIRGLTDVSSPTWSPTGEFVAFTSDHTLWVANSDGTDAAPVPSLGGSVGPPAWGSR